MLLLEIVIPLKEVFMLFSRSPISTTLTLSVGAVFVKSNPSTVTSPDVMSTAGSPTIKVLSLLSPLRVKDLSKVIVPV